MKIAKRYPWIDVLYTIGIFLVIFGHSHPSDWTVFSGTVFEKVILFVYTFHMPLFFFIAGFLFMNSKALSRLGYKEWIKNKSIRLLTPYVVLSLIALLPKYYLEQHSFVTLDYLVKVIFMPRVGVWGHFWFIPVLLLCYAIFGLWKSMTTDKNIVYMLGSITVLSLILYFIPFSTHWLGISDLKKMCIYFCIGMGTRYFETYGKKTTKLFDGVYVVIEILMAVLLFNCWQVNEMIMLCIAVLMVLACYQLAKIIENSKITTLISKNNFTIYIYSWLFQAVAMDICGRLGIVWYLICVIMFVIGFIGPMSMIWVYVKTKSINNRFFDLILGMK